jgi:glycosyltransferase involved in cell wall biosynthesis
LDPEISVLLPVRDGEATLVPCLRSLFAQKDTSFEVVAVDDHSRDRSSDILRSYAATEGRLRIAHPSSPGLVPALNSGLAVARGDLVARMDADDLCRPERLMVQAARMRGKGSTDVLGCRVRLLSSPGHQNAGMRRYVAWQNGLLDHEAIVRDLFVESPLAHPTVMMRTRTLRDLGGYRDFHGPEDYDLWLRAFGRGLRFGKVPEVLVSWRDSPGRLSRSDPRYGEGPFLLVKLEALEAGPLRGRRGVVVWGAGRIGKGWGRALRSRGHPLLAFVDINPRRIGRTIQGARVLAPEEARVPGALHLAAVGQPGARERIRKVAGDLGLRDGEDLLAVA